MLALVQRVKRAEVSSNGKKSSIGEGLVVYIGINKGDTKRQAEVLASKIIHARLFDWEDKSFEKSVKEMNFGVLLISQFTLYADTKRGRRPDFGRAMKATEAKPLYCYFCEKMRSEISETKSGDFQSHMDVEYINDGPVSVIFEEN
ncbi:D-tyrosyl-tRNA(Tyr) deacylase [candidate division WOR-3 bacterium]|nr:D-tyrosyl-tRNA(Tyr) deacylase [candidate division WOR-3 bacterium]